MCSHWNDQATTLVEEVWVRGIEDHDARHVPEGLELPDGTQLDMPPPDPRAPAAA